LSQARRLTTKGADWQAVCQALENPRAASRWLRIEKRKTNHKLTKNCSRECSIWHSKAAFWRWARPAGFRHSLNAVCVRPSLVLLGFYLQTTGALDLKSTAFVIFDCTTPDAKMRTLLNEPTTKNDLRHLLQKHIFPQCRDGDMKLAMF
jgi:hypothetical protein